MIFIVERLKGSTGKKPCPEAEKRLVEGEERWTVDYKDPAEIMRLVRWARKDVLLSYDAKGTPTITIVDDYLD